MQRTLAKAERMIRTLQDRIADQKRQIRDLQGQLRHEEGLVIEREDLKSEIVDLKGEIRELTRANREHVERIQALRAENTKLKAGGKARRADGQTAEPAPSSVLGSVLS